MRYATVVAAVVVCVVGGSAAVVPAQAQVDTTRAGFDHRFWPWLQRVDEAALRRVYHWEYRALVGTMRGLDESSYSIFYSAPLWVAGYAIGFGELDDLAAAYRLGISEGIAYGMQRGLKKVFRRQRPFYRLADVPSKSIRYPDPVDIFAFPSGHAMASFTIASSVALSYPEWYVMIPVTVWASGVSLSRVWLGVHYPSDILTGAAIGVAIGTGVHLVRYHITPGFLRQADAQEEPSGRFVISFSVPLR